MCGRWPTVRYVIVRVENGEYKTTAVERCVNNNLQQVGNTALATTVVGPAAAAAKIAMNTAVPVRRVCE